MAGKVESKDAITRMKSNTRRKKGYLRYIKKYKKSHGTSRGAKKWGRYQQENEPGSSQMRKQMGGLDSATYADINKMRDKRKKK